MKLVVAGLVTLFAFSLPEAVSAGAENRRREDRPHWHHRHREHRHAVSSSSPSRVQPSTQLSSAAQAQPSASLNSTMAPGKQLFVDFSALSAASELGSILDRNGLYVSEYTVGSTPIAHTFQTSNVDWVDGALRLKVGGQSGRGTTTGAEIGTYESQILYGTVTTRAKATSVKGVCQGFFFYKDDHHELDIELLSSYYTEGGPDIKPGLELTNQALVPGQESSNRVLPFKFDPTADFHDYTIQWTPTSAIYSVDGEVVLTLEENVPTTPMGFIWNNWSDGDDRWTAGPPEEDAYLLIQSVSGTWTTA